MDPDAVTIPPRPGGPRDRSCCHAADAITVQAAGRLAGLRQPRGRPRASGYDSPEALLATPIREVMSQIRAARRGRPSPPARPAAQPARARRTRRGPPERRPLPRCRQRRGPLVPGAGNADRRTTPVAVRLVINTFQDVTQLKRTEHRLRLLADAGCGDRSLRRLPGRPPAAGRPAGRAPSATGASSTSSSPDQPVDARGGRALPIPPSAGWAQEIQRRYPTDPGSRPVGCMTSSGPATPTVLTEVLRGSPAGGRPRRRALSPAAGRPTSAPSVIVPLRARGEVFGALTLVGSAGTAPVHRRRPAPHRGARRARRHRGRQRAAPARGERGRPACATTSWPWRRTTCATPLAVILANLQLRPTAAGRARPRPRADVFKNLDAAERTTPQADRGWFLVS